MTLADIAPHRLFNQGLAASTLRQPSEVVARLGALQAQDYAGAKWSIGLRLPGATDPDVERAVAHREIVRTWPLRGTLHFAAAADVRWLLALAAPRVVAGSAPRYRQLELDEATFGLSRDLLAGALQGGGARTRSEINALLERAGIATRDQRSYHLLQRAALEGLLCFGAPRGRQHTFVLLDEWVPRAGILERDLALAELAARYFTSRGPATLQDFVWWSGLPTADARAGLESVAAGLIRETVDGVTYWMAPASPPPQERSPSACMPPGFDEYLLGYRARGAVLDARYARQVNPGNGIFSPVLVVDGRVVGTWKRTLRKASVQIETRPFAPLGEAERQAVAAAAERYGAFLGLSVGWS